MRKIGIIHDCPGGYDEEARWHSKAAELGDGQAGRSGTAISWHLRVPYSMGIGRLRSACAGGPGHGEFLPFSSATAVH